MQINLRGAVFGKYKNISAFAKSIGWERKKASDIVNGKRRPSADEMEKISDALDVHDPSTFVALFFSNQVRNVD